MQMDVCSHIRFPVNDVKSIHGFCKDTTFKSTYGLMDGFCVDELAYGATKLLNIQDDIHEIPSSIPPPHEKGVFHLKDDFNPQSSNASFLPKRLKPVSAMKGSREKSGVGPPKKLTVKWAPDVYDPVPCSALDIVINKPRKHGKKSSKEKSSSSKSSSKGSKSKGKDKKQSRKRSGKSSDAGF